MGLGAVTRLRILFQSLAHLSIATWTQPSSVGFQLSTHRLEARLDFADQPREGLLGEAVLGQHALGCQRGAQVRVEQEGCIAPRLRAQLVVTLSVKYRVVVRLWT